MFYFAIECAIFVVDNWGKDLQTSELIRINMKKLNKYFLDKFSLTFSETLTLAFIGVSIVYFTVMLIIAISQF